MSRSRRVPPAGPSQGTVEAGRRLETGALPQARPSTTRSPRPTPRSKRSLHPSSDPSGTDARHELQTTVALLFRRGGALVGTRGHPEVEVESPRAGLRVR